MLAERQTPYYYYCCYVLFIDLWRNHLYIFVRFEALTSLALLYACFKLVSWISLLFDPEDRGDMFFWNVD
jgi:hypothetical protein